MTSPKKSVLSTKSCRLITMMLLTASFFFVELIVGYITHSLALVADSFHMLSDIIALIVGFVAVRYAKRDTPKNTYGWQRAEVVGALVNAVFLFALCFTILVDAVERLVMGDKIKDPLLVLIVGGVGLAVNLLGILLFSSHGMGHGHSHGGGSSHSHSQGQGYESVKEPDEKESLANGTKIQDGTHDVESGIEVNHKPQRKHSKHDASTSQLNMRGVFLHVLGDALGSVVVIISALVVMFTDGDWVFCIDPVLSILIVIIISTTTWPLFKQSSMILLQSIPTGIDMDDIDKKLREECSYIDNIHEFHVWQLTGSKLIATLHISVSSLEEYGGVIEQATRILHQEGIHSTTIQPEFICMKESSTESCGIPCPTDSCSDTNKCCSTTTKRISGNSKSVPTMSQLQMEVNDLENVPLRQSSDVEEQSGPMDLLQGGNSRAPKHKAFGIPDIPCACSCFSENSLDVSVSYTLCSVPHIS
ncbi:zinc homeostasis factor 1-like isoform X3 [Lytechinus variegatus]|uniref:zinc homeostasis factor 1-like isoform X3 n=1 Tax=Lytechinus variegatus TaxID=7654 RepID=UPI001BB18FD6|nr:zinc homeostasis factor 1-like isoform X3 [Lytechinus variegatus]